jgi:rRNA maturation protein Nop10
MYVSEQVTEKKTLKCQHCGRIWNYGGKRQYYANCNNCGYHVHILKNTVPHSGQKVSSHGLNVVSKSTQTQEPEIDL